jgi:hypothetical protein
MLKTPLGEPSVEGQPKGRESVSKETNALVFNSILDRKKITIEATQVRIEPLHISKKARDDA